MVDYIAIYFDKDVDCYGVGVMEHFDPFPNVMYCDTKEMAMKHAMYLADHHKVEIRVIGEDGKLEEIIANGLL